MLFDFRSFDIRYGLVQLLFSIPYIVVDNLRCAVESRIHLDCVSIDASTIDRICSATATNICLHAELLLSHMHGCCHFQVANIL